MLSFFNVATCPCQIWRYTANEIYTEVFLVSAGRKYWFKLPPEPMIHFLWEIFLWRLIERVRSITSLNGFTKYVSLCLVHAMEYMLPRAHDLAIGYEDDNYGNR